MDQENPYSTPKVELIEPASLISLPDFSASQLRLLGWLALICCLGTLISLALGALSELFGRHELVVADKWFGSLLTLLSVYLLLRLKALLVARFAVQGLDWPVYLSIAFSLIAQGMLLGLTDEVESLGLPMLVMFLVMALLGGATLWLGIVLLRVREGYGLLRTLAWLYLVSGAMQVSVILMVLAFLPLFAAQFVIMLIFFRAAEESR